MAWLLRRLGRRVNLYRGVDDDDDDDDDDEQPPLIWDSDRVRAVGSR